MTSSPWSYPRTLHSTSTRIPGRPPLTGYYESDAPTASGRQLAVEVPLDRDLIVDEVDDPEPDPIDLPGRPAGPFGGEALEQGVPRGREAGTGTDPPCGRDHRPPPCDLAGHAGEE